MGKIPIPVPFKDDGPFSKAFFEKNRNDLQIWPSLRSEIRRRLFKELKEARLEDWQAKHKAFLSVSPPP